MQAPSDPSPPASGARSEPKASGGGGAGSARAVTARLGRRAFLTGTGATAGWLLARGLGVPGWIAPDETAAGFPDLLRSLAASLTPRQHELLVLPIDHPTRQIANTIAVLDRPHLGTLLSPAQQALARGLCSRMLSPKGRADFAGTLAVEGRLEGCVLAIYGEPESGRAQVVLSGGHVMLRGEGDSASGEAFGGGLAYGHQIGNHRWRVEGNSFAPHGDAANRLYTSLSAEERARAVLPSPPHELVLQVQRAGARFEGARVGSLSEPAQEEAARLVNTMLASYPQAARARALSFIDGNGGLETLHVAYYATHGFYSDMRPWSALTSEERARRGDPYWQVWRIEGPGTILHFQGYPHVHAYLQVVRDPARANLGEALGETAAGIQGEPMRRLLEAALRFATGEALAFHAEPVPGRFCPGEITTGLAYSLDPYGNRVVVADIRGGAMSAGLRERLAAGGTPVEPNQRYRVATTEYFAATPEIFGEPDAVESDGGLLRDALVAQLRAGGLAEATG